MRNYTQGRVCSECPTPIGDKNSSGLCRVHFNKRLARDPAVAARKSAGLKAYAAANPEVMSERGKRAAATRLSDPAHVAWMVEHMRTTVQPASLSHPDAAKWRRVAVMRCADTKLSWCPPAYRPLYRQLLSKLKIAADARAVVLDQIEKDRGDREPLAFAIDCAVLSFANDNGLSVTDARRRLMGEAA